MKSRKQLLAAGSAVTLVAGAVFFSAAPASAAHNSPECIAAQDRFTVALHAAELNADLEVELALALQNLVNARATVDLLDVEGALTIEEIDALVVEAVADVRTKQLPNIHALINSNAGAGSAVGDARALLEIVVDGEVDGEIDPVTAEALLALNIKVEDFLLEAALDIDGLTAAVGASVVAGDLTQAEADLILAALVVGELDEASLTLLAGAGIVIDDFRSAPVVDRAGIKAQLELAIEQLILDAEAQVNAALDSGDLAAILAAEAQLEALLGVDLDFDALVQLQDQRLAAQAILDAKANLADSIAVVTGLRAQLDALDVDLVELEVLFDAAIEACAGVVVGGPEDGRDGQDGQDGQDGKDGQNGGAGVTTGTGGTGTGVATGVTTGGIGTVSTGATNRGMNVQTAASTASFDPAGTGVLAAGIGFVVVAGALAARRVRNS